MKNKGRFTDREFDESNNNLNLDDLKESKQRDKKLGVALREVLICLAFVGMTMTVSYQMLDTDAYRYQMSLKNFFGAGDRNNIFYEVFTQNLSCLHHRVLSFDTLRRLLIKCC